MQANMKRLALFSLSLCSYLWKLIPSRLRLGLFTTFILLESRGRNVAYSLDRLFTIKDRTDWIINERAMVYGNGEHPKHKLTFYHDFFIERIRTDARVLDVGCGYGAVARSVAQALPNSVVLGIDLNPFQINQAKQSLNPSNLSFIVGDATKNLPTGPWDIIILSNCLEHISARVDLLKTLVRVTEAHQVLIRIPLFERDWQMALRKEIGTSYFSDPDHKIEHTLDEFYSELSAANLAVTEIKTLWGEIWANCHVR